MAEESLIRRPTETPTPTVRELAMVLFRRRSSFLSAATIVLVATIFYVLAGDRYQSEMKVLVRPGRADAPVSPAENAPLDLTRLAISEEEINSEVELLRDDDILRKVVTKNAIGGRDWFHFLRLGETGEQRIEREARHLAKKLKVEPVKKTNLIAVSYASTDPRHARNVLDTLASVYIEKHAAVYRPGGELRFLEQQTAESRRQLQEAQQKLLQFTASHGVVAATPQRDLALQKLSEFDANYRQTRVEISETQQRIWELDAQLSTLSERTTTQLRTADNPELLRALKSELLDLQLRRTQLLTKFEPTHRLVQEADQQIAQAQAAIAAETHSPVRDETTDKNAHYEWATSELQQAQVQLKGLQARASALASQQAAYRSLTRQLGEDAITQEDLENRAKAAEENSLLYLKKQQEARMADALDQRGIANVTIAEEPIAPALPLWSTWTVLAVGLAAASAAGSGAAFLTDYLDPVLRTPEDALLCLDSPVLASLPRNALTRRLA
jgi:uncharacterized protein involved in exopolysaccharide biosynthesis